MAARAVEYIKPDKARVAAADQQLEEQQRVIEYDTKEFTVEVLVAKFGTGGDEDDIYIPPYQRAFTWEQSRRSRFIESMLIGLPIPFLFFGDMKDGRLEVVDGSQRLRTCEAFLHDKLMLVGCERLNQLDGFRFSDLPKSQQRRLKNRSIRAVVLSKHATPADRADLFDRINTGSLEAKDAEVRRGSMPGPVTDLVDALANHARFKRLCPMSETSERLRAREELVTRFFTFNEYFDKDLPEYRDRVGAYLDKWLQEANRRASERPEIITQLQAEFEQVMVFVDQNFPHGFTKGPNLKTTPFVRFDAIAVGVAQALQKKPKLKPAVSPADWIASDKFMELTTSNAANVRSKILGRIEFVRDKLLEV